MRLGIQPKLVLTLVLAGLLPLALSLVVVLVIVTRQRTVIVGQSFRAQARLQANHISTVLSSQLDFLMVVTQLPGTTDYLEKSNVQPLPPIEMVAIDARWKSLAPDDPLVRQLLDNPIALRWKAVQSHQPRIAEVIVTDALGRLVAATNKTTDYFQADEEWWKQCYSDGRGSVVVTDISYDESAIFQDGDPGVLVMNVCLPIYDRITGPRKALGVAKISLSSEWLLDQIEDNTWLGYRSARAWLVNSEGEAISSTLSGQPRRLPESIFAQVRQERIGWMRNKEIIGGELLGFSNVRVPAPSGKKTSDVEWYVLVMASHDETVAPVYQLTWLMLGSGLLLIILCFTIGVLISRREIVRPIQELATAARELERGNIDYRLNINASGTPFREDELGKLAADFNRMADQLSENLRRIQVADETKRQFIDLASHELRTPIAYILGITDLARRQNPSDDGVNARIYQRASRLMHIVDNMFKLLHSEQFSMPLRWQEIDVAEIARMSCHELEPFLQQRDLKWDLQMEPELPKVRADHDKLRDILTNLFSNAIRFSPNGGTIVVKIKRTGEGVELAVTNSGPGISPEDMPRLFQPFYVGNQLLHHTSGEYAYLTRGMGLGLTVVKRFIEMHGGIITAESSDTGTTFRIRLPLNAHVPLTE